MSGFDEIQLLTKRTSPTEGGKLYYMWYVILSSIQQQQQQSLYNVLLGWFITSTFFFPTAILYFFEEDFFFCVCVCISHLFFLRCWQNDKLKPVRVNETQFNKKNKREFKRMKKTYSKTIEIKPFD
jgi:hypothetical protein